MGDMFLRDGKKARQTFRPLTNMKSTLTDMLAKTQEMGKKEDHQRGKLCFLNKDD